MAIKYEPEIGNWYQSGSSLLFKVVAIDESDETIEIQYFDGTVGELELDLWEGLSPELLDAPDDWSGPFDDVDDDMTPSSYSDDTNTRKSWDSVLEGYEDN